MGVGGCGGLGGCEWWGGEGLNLNLEDFWKSFKTSKFDIKSRTEYGDFASWESIFEKPSYLL